MTTPPPTAPLPTTSLPAAPLPTANPQDVGLSASALTRLSHTLEDRVARGHIPGAVALVTRHGKVALHQAFGRLDPARDLPMPLDAIFRIYSMTKPLVSVAVMLLCEEGRLLLGDPIHRYLPEFARPRVAVFTSGAMETTDARRAVTVQDLLRHTSGLTYEFRGNTPLHKAYLEARVHRLRQTNQEQAAALGGLPLLFQPGARWEYSRSTDVLGRLVEVISGQALGQFLAERILQPLGMQDTGFAVPDPHHDRIAEPFPSDPEGGTKVALLDVRRPAIFESGGGGMVSTATDYARFLHTLLNGGTFGHTPLLGRKTIELMTADHLGGLDASPELLPPGHGFGLGFAVRLAAGMAPFPGSVGSYFWGGVAGTTFWVDPAERLTAVLMIQAPGQREHYRVLFRDMVYAAL